MTRYLALSETEVQQLIHLRDHAPKSYLRERAAALLKVADGQSAAHVARHGLLRRRKPDTVYSWLDRFLIDGIAGLAIQAGRLTDVASTDSSWPLDSSDRIRSRLWTV